MRRQKCSQCGTMLDISRLEKGSKFACANCGAILVVGQAVAVKRSFKDAGPAFKPKEKKGGAAPAPVRPRPRAGGSPERRRPGGEASQRKSKLPLFLGIGAVVVVAIVVGVVATSGGGGADGGSGPRRETPAQWWEAKGPGLASADAATLRSWLAEAKEKGYDLDPAFWGAKEEAIFRALLKKAPRDREANARAGRKSLRDYPNFDQVWAEMTDNFRLLPNEMKDFLDAYATAVDEGKPLWMAAAKYEKAKGILDRYGAWRKRLEENPAAEKIDRAESEARAILDTKERKVDFVSRAAGPFLLLLSYAKGDGADALRAERERQAAQYAKVLTRCAQEFETRFRQPLDLPPIEKGRYFTHIVVDRHEDLTRFIRGEGFDAVGDIPAYFSPRTKWSHMLVSQGASEGEDAAKLAKDRENIGGDIAHEATHQLQWCFSRDPKRKLLNYMEEWNGIWLTEGLAEYLGGGIRLDPASGKVEFTGRPPRRVAYLKEMRDNGVPFLQVRDLVQLDSYDAFGRYLRGWMSLIESDEDMPESAATWLRDQNGMIAKVMYAHSWFLIYFLNEYDNGKYKEKFLDLLMTALRGKRKPEKYRKDASVAERWASADRAFEEIFGLEDEKAWKQFQREHDRFLKKTVRD